MFEMLATFVTGTPFCSLRFGSVWHICTAFSTQAISASMRTQSLKIQVSPVTVADEDLRDFAEHLSYAYRGQSYQQRILDFPAEQQGADAAMHLRIVLHSHDNTLVLLRAPSSDRVFHHNWYFPCS